MHFVLRRWNTIAIVLSQKVVTSAIFALVILATYSSDGFSASQIARVRDGSRDFDFLYGKWRMPNHRLHNKLAGSREWDDFITCDEADALPGGIGNIDYWRTTFWKDFVAVTIRTYDPLTGLWRIYSVDNKFSRGVVGPPVTGEFDNNIGVFTGHATFNGKPATVRFTWTISPKRSDDMKWEDSLNPQHSEVAASWEQAFSTDNGKTWETNWYSEYIHDDTCTPQPDYDWTPF